MRKQVYVKRRARLRSLLIFGIAASLLVTLLIRTDRAIRPNLCAVCESETQQFASRFMADSIAEVLAEESYSYSDFATLVYDSSGNVTAVETMTQNVNAMQSAMLTKVQDRLDACRDVTLEVSLGTATGVWLFAGRGPHVSVRLMPIGNASVKLISALESAGVNQTCHTIRAEVTAEIQAAIPFSQTTAQVHYSCLITETVIVGSVPESYLEFGGT
ncbi:sporulation protein YunB [uncultured Ruminococcus sp.]|uniref:sporulation protein YunB n=1 Tax=uncultured Ruminococcus sp. TaxID=165186 RepID=UPI0026133E2E|nr:sporulation protein YunB [uncultured Ruminococcus sp.]